MPTFYEDSNMFQLSSGNKPPFKEMGSSPVKEKASPAKDAILASWLKNNKGTLAGQSFKDMIGKGENVGGLSGIFDWLRGQGQDKGENIDSANVPMHGDDRHTGKTLASIPGVHTPLKPAGPTGSMDAETNLGRSVQFQ
jgi:hypothetical protein